MKKLTLGLILILTLSFFILMVNVNVVSANVEYTELKSSDVSVNVADTWEEIDLSSYGIPDYAVVELLAWNGEDTSTNYVGVRSTSTPWARMMLIAEGENGGLSTMQFLTQADSTGSIELYSSSTTQTGFNIIGYWEGVNFTERWIWSARGDFADESWYNHSTSIPSNLTGLYTLTNTQVRYENMVGIRSATSDLERIIDVHEAEGGGNRTASMFVQSTVDSVVSIYFEDSEYNKAYLQGWFNSSIYFNEDYVINDSLGVDFNEWDISEYLDKDGRVIDAVVTHSSAGAYQQIGLREGGSVIKRSWSTVEAESGGLSGFGICVNTSNTGIVESYGGVTKIIYYLGYFVPTNYTTPITPSASPKVNGLFDAWTEYNVSSVHVIRGTYVSGDLTSLEFNDTDYYLVDEVTGVEGFDVRFNFTDIPDTILSLSHRVRCEYEGNPAHDVDIELWNFISGAWIDSIHLPEHAFQWNNESMSLNSIDFNDGGDVWLRIVHHTSGVDTHYVNVDYFQLRGFIPASVGGGGLIWGIGAIFISVPILLILSYVLRRK